MGDLAKTLIHESYDGMKQRFPEHGHRQWEVQPLPYVNLKYAAIDGYLSSELYKRLKKILKGLTDAPPREVLCPNCEDEKWLASLPPAWRDDSRFRGSTYQEWVSYCRANEIPYDPNSPPARVTFSSERPSRSGWDDAAGRMKRGWTSRDHSRPSCGANTRAGPGWGEEARAGPVSTWEAGTIAIGKRVKQGQGLYRYGNQL